MAKTKTFADVQTATSVDKKNIIMTDSTGHLTKIPAEKVVKRTTAEGGEVFNNSYYANQYAHGEGVGTMAKGVASHAEGVGTTTMNVGEHASGRYNVNKINQIFSVGIGNEHKNKNAVEIYDDGRCYMDGVGGHNGEYDGDAASEGALTLQQLINPVKNFEQYYDNGNGKVVPIRHPDLSTQASILPYKFGGKYVYEVVLIGNNEKGTGCFSSDFSIDLPVEAKIIYLAAVVNTQSTVSITKTFKNINVAIESGDVAGGRRLIRGYDFNKAVGLERGDIVFTIRYIDMEEQSYGDYSVLPVEEKVIQEESETQNQK